MTAVEGSVQACEGVRCGFHADATWIAIVVRKALPTFYFHDTPSHFRGSCLPCEVVPSREMSAEYIGFDGRFFLDCHVHCRGVARKAVSVLLCAVCFVATNGGGTGWSTAACAEDGSPRVLLHGRSPLELPVLGEDPPLPVAGAVPDLAALGPTGESTHRQRYGAEMALTDVCDAQRFLPLLDRQKDGGAVGLLRCAQ